MSSSDVERIAQAAYEAHRREHPATLPPWEDATERDREAWRAAMSAAVGDRSKTRSEAAPARSLHVQAGDQRRIFYADASIGREGTLVINDEFASSKHARFWLARGMWYVEDLHSTNGTWLNGRRIHAAQLLKRGDKIKVGHTVITVISA